MNHPLTESIPETDWSATPITVQKLFLSLEQERNALRERLDRIEQTQNTNHKLQEERIQRYHALVERQFLVGLTLEQQTEIEQLGKEIDRANSTFYPSLESLGEAISSKTGQPVK